jgi:hypothetical protein
MEERLLDGAIICNNPALYAYQIARFMKGKDKIRLLSIGTGSEKFGKESKANADMFDSKIDLFGMYSSMVVEYE